MSASASSGKGKRSIGAIGISYQMHGLVAVGKDLKPLRPSIIWCDSRAVKYGKNALNRLGSDFCLSHLLNSPGNFTASKLAWVKENEPEMFGRIYKIMLPGDYIAHEDDRRDCDIFYRSFRRNLLGFQKRQDSQVSCMEFFGFSHGSNSGSERILFCAGKA